jgi:hypothetical protein
MTKYRIVRMYLKGASRAVRGQDNLTLEEAQEWCRNPETSWKTCQKAENVRRTATRGAWFDGYEVDKKHA